MSSYFVFSEAHDPRGPVGAGPIICKVCADLADLGGGFRASNIPPEPTPIDVPEPPIEPAEPPLTPTPVPELTTTGPGWSTA